MRRRLHENSFQETRDYYKQLKDRTGVDVLNLVWGKGKFMNTKHPGSNVEPLYSEKLWNEFVKWAKDVEGVDIVSFKEENIVEEIESLNEGDIEKMSGYNQIIKGIKEAKSFGTEYLAEFNYLGEEYSVEGEVTRTNTATTEHVRIYKNGKLVGEGSDKWYNRPWYRFRFANALSQALIAWLGNGYRRIIWNACETCDNPQEVVDNIVDELTSKEESLKEENEECSFDVNKIADALKEEVEYFKDGQPGCATLKLNGRLAICVGWESGYENDDTCIVDDGYGLVAAIKVWTSDDLRTDFEYINYPYYKDGEVIDTTVSLCNDTDFFNLAKYFEKEYCAIKDFNIDEDGLIKDEEEVDVEEESLKESDSNPNKKYYDFLDGLRKLGVTNMFGATPYLVQAYPELDKEQARDILSSWMRDFGKDKNESLKESNDEGKFLTYVRDRENPNEVVALIVSDTTPSSHIEAILKNNDEDFEDALPSDCEVIYFGGKPNKIRY